MEKINEHPEIVEEEAKTGKEVVMGVSDFQVPWFNFFFFFGLGTVACSYCQDEL